MNVYKPVESDYGYTIIFLIKYPNRREQSALALCEKDRIVLLSQLEYEKVRLI